MVPRCAPRGTALAVLLLCLPALAGCGADEEPRVQFVAYCQGILSGDPGGDVVDVEFRQGTTVVARGSMPAGMAITVEVPAGGVQIWVDDVQVGSVAEGVSTDGPYRRPAPDEVSYLRGAEGCPATPPPGPAGEPAG